jgi:hypothetical protein
VPCLKLSPRRAGAAERFEIFVQDLAGVRAIVDG